MGAGVTWYPALQVGDVSVIVDGNGDPLCIIEMVEVEIRPFNTVDEHFAFEYGEGERTRAYWLSAKVSLPCTRRN